MLFKCGKKDVSKRSQRQDSVDYVQLVVKGEKIIIKRVEEYVTCSESFPFINWKPMFCLAAELIHNEHIHINKNAKFE